MCHFKLELLSFTASARSPLESLSNPRLKRQRMIREKYPIKRTLSQENELK